jgi:hypothetical protein
MKACVALGVLFSSVVIPSLFAQDLYVHGVRGTHWNYEQYTVLLYVVGGTEILKPRDRSVGRELAFKTSRARSEL